jgi:hypothetical protein
MGRMILRHPPALQSKHICGCTTCLSLVLEVQKTRSMEVVDGRRGVPQPFTPLRQHQNGTFSPKDCFLGYSGCIDRGHFANLESLPPPWIGFARMAAGPAHQEITTSRVHNLWRVRNIRRDRDVEADEARSSSREAIAPALAIPRRILPSRRPQRCIWDGQRYSMATPQMNRGFSRGAPPENQID